VPQGLAVGGTCECAESRERQQNDLAMTEADPFRQTRGASCVKQGRDGVLVKIREIVVRGRVRGQALVVEPPVARSLIGHEVLHTGDLLPN